MLNNIETYKKMIVQSKIDIKMWQRKIDIQKGLIDIYEDGILKENRKNEIKI